MEKFNAKQTIRVTQTGSPIARNKTQRTTLVAMGLNKLHKTKEVSFPTQEAADAWHGQVKKVEHLVSVEMVK